MMLAYTTPDVLKWARESAGYSLADAAERIRVGTEKLASAEAGEGQLTLRQAERAASVYERPLAALFLPEPPFEEPQESQFRRLPGAPELPWPPEMLLLARRVRERQSAALELHEALDEAIAWDATVKTLPREVAVLSRHVRGLLGIGAAEQQSWRDRTGYTALRHWTDAVEALGVFVLQDGSMPLDTMRGFAATESRVPVIVVNTKDDARARAFTIIHELGHLCLYALGVANGSETEAWCNQFAGEVLMPRDQLSVALSALVQADPLQAVDAIALQFSVTPYAAAVRIAGARLWDRKITERVIAAIRSRRHRQRSGGGDYYRTQIGRLSPAFTRLVFTALDSQAVTSPAASGLLGGVKVNNLPRLRDYLDNRALQA